MAARLDALHEGRLGRLPALAQVLRNLLAAREHAVLAQRRQPLEQWMLAQLQNRRAQSGCWAAPLDSYQTLRTQRKRVPDC